MSDPIGNPYCWFSHPKTHITGVIVTFSSEMSAAASVGFSTVVFCVLPGGAGLGARASRPLVEGGV